MAFWLPQTSSSERLDHRCSAPPSRQLWRQLPSLASVICLALLMAACRFPSAPQEARLSEQGKLANTKGAQSSDPALASLAAQSATATSSSSLTLDTGVSVSYHAHEVALPQEQPDPEGSSWPRWDSGSSAPYALQFSYPNNAAQPLKGYTIILDIGHGGSDPGAVVTSPDGEVTEKAINLSISQKLIPRLEALGAKVLPTRHDDTFFSLYHRIAQAGQIAIQTWQQILQHQPEVDSEYKAGHLKRLAQLSQQLEAMKESNLDSYAGRGIAAGMGMNEDMRYLLDLERELEPILYIALHANFSPSAEPRGFVTYVSTNQVLYRSELDQIVNEADSPDIKPINPFYPRYNDEERLRLGKQISESVIQAIPALKPEKNPIRQGNYAFLREENFRSVLLECGFMSHPQDLALLLDPAQQELLSTAIATGLGNYVLQPSSK